MEYIITLFVIAVSVGTWFCKNKKTIKFDSTTKDIYSINYSIEAGAIEMTQCTPKEEKEDHWNSINPPALYNISFNDIQGVTYKLNVYAGNCFFVIEELKKHGFKNIKPIKSSFCTNDVLETDAGMDKVELICSILNKANE